jgi:hypothetical protein
MMRLKRLIFETLEDLARAQGPRFGPFSVHVMQSISECSAEKFHSAMAAFF